MPTSTRQGRTWVPQVYTWLKRPHDEAPAELLRSEGYDLLSDMVMGHIREPEKQWAGLYGTARQTVSCLTDREVSQWITSARDTTVDTDPCRIRPRGLRARQGTLYSLSREGAGTAGPLVTALTVAVVEAAEKYATSQPAAGSRHGCSASSMRPRTSAAGRHAETLVRIERENLRRRRLRSRSTGSPASSANTATSTSPHSKTGSSSSRQENKDEILSVADLTALPRFRAILLASGVQATMIETFPWMNGPHAQEVRDSLATKETAGVAPVAMAVAAHNPWTDGNTA